MARKSRKEEIITRPLYHLSEEGYRLLLRLEQPRLTPRLNGSGRYVVGLRHTGDDIDPDRRYTPEEIATFFETDKIPYEADVNRIFDPVFMTQHMFDAMFCFAFSVGKISTTELGQMIQRNPYDDRIRDFWCYTYTKANRDRLLSDRRQKEVDYYFQD